MAVPEISLGSCWTMPVIGMGTCAYPLADSETAKTAILEAIRSGYCHFDTAFAYGSEKPLGGAIAETLRLGVVKSRDEFFVTTKLWCSFAAKEENVPAIKMSLSNLQLEYVDMCLIHWPIKLSKEVRDLPIEKSEHILPFDMKSIWEGMEECKKLRLTKGNGVSNFSCLTFEELLSTAIIPPVVKQVEMNPIWQQKELGEFCKAKGIHITAYSPLGANNTKWGDDRVVGCDVFAEIAKAKGKSTAQANKN